MGRVKQHFHVTGKKSIMRFAVLFHDFMLSMKVNSIVILNFHWDLLYIVDMSECEKGSFWKSACPKPQRQTFFPVISTSSLSTHLFSPTGLFQLHLPPIATAMCERTSKWGHSIFVRFLGKMSTDREHWLWSYASTSDGAQVRERYYPTPPLRDVTHLQRSMTYVRTCKWTCCGVTSWECASTWTLLPHPTPPQGTYIKNA